VAKTETRSWDKLEAGATRAGFTRFAVPVSSSKVTKVIPLAVLGRCCISTNLATLIGRLAGAMHNWSLVTTPREAIFHEKMPEDVGTS